MLLGWYTFINFCRDHLDGIRDSIRPEGEKDELFCVLLDRPLYVRPLNVRYASHLYVLYARDFVSAVYAPFVCTVCASFECAECSVLRRFNGLIFCFPSRSSGAHALFLLMVLFCCACGNRYCKFDAITHMADMFNLPYTGVIDRPDLQVHAFTISSQNRYITI